MENIEIVFFLSFLSQTHECEAVQTLRKTAFPAKKKKLNNVLAQSLKILSRSARRAEQMCAAAAAAVVMWIHLENSTRQRLIVRCDS